MADMQGGNLPSKRNSKELRSNLIAMSERMADRRRHMTVTREALLRLGTEQELRAQIRALRQAQAGPTPQEWANHYAALVLTLPAQGMDAVQASHRFRIFCEDLQGIPGPAIAAALRRYRTEPSLEPKFRPQSCQIAAMCKEELAASKRILAACDEMERVLDEPEEVVAPDAEVVIGTSLWPIQTITRAEATRSYPSFSRAGTDPAELTAALERRRGI